ncbi:MAG: LptF/LptG family permease [Muribaculum sp.]|nr:LptF/LptG family permease [Muribaculum sp.]
MRIIKRLDIFILKTFLPLFAMTFFIVLFIVLMQFLWKYIDDLVGKGLSMDVLGELFFYAAVSMVPMALPLAILLASLMTFGNLGERFELTAMKASGISLLRVMKPLIVLISCVAVGAFFFQNDVLPKAQVKMWTLLFSMRQKSPELEIPEGVFYDQIPGYNLFVKEKDRNTGMLRDVMIYANPSGGSNTTILLSDSAQMATTKDMRYLYLHLYRGEQFENLRQQNAADINVPFRRETFFDKQVLIPFDANFNRLDESSMRNQYVGKNIRELQHTIDSVGLLVDSMGLVYSGDLHQESFRMLDLDDGSLPSRRSGRMKANAKSTRQPLSQKKVKAPELDIDALLVDLPASQRTEVFSRAHSYVKRQREELQFRAEEMAQEQKVIRRHKIELLKKFTLSVACLIFFFIGAPLGAIIRKGGLGTPLVISVLLFLVYYIIDNTGYKMARDGHAIVWVGMWLSTFILAPLSIYVTYKAMNDSAVFDKDRYVALLQRLLGIRQPRSVAYKEVIINDIDNETACRLMERLRHRCLMLLRTLPGRMSYRYYWMHGINLRAVDRLADTLNADINYLSDCRDLSVIDLLSQFPDIYGGWTLRPSRKAWLGITMMILFPVGTAAYLLGLRSLRRLKKELRLTISTANKIMDKLAKEDLTKGQIAQ